MSHLQQLLSHFQDRDTCLTETSILNENHVTLQNRQMPTQVNKSDGRRPGSTVGRYEVYDQSFQFLLCFFEDITGAAFECVSIGTLSSLYHPHLLCFLCLSRGKAKHWLRGLNGRGNVNHTLSCQWHPDMHHNFSMQVPLDRSYSTCRINYNDIACKLQVHLQLQYSKNHKHNPHTP